MSRKTWSPSKENLLLQHLSKLERSPSAEEQKKYGSQCSINLEDNLIDLPTEPKRRRLTADDTPSSIGSQVSSQMSSRSHSPSLSELLDDSLVSTPSASPSGTLKEHFRRKYRKDELWAAIETNYKYLMDKGIIEACQNPESDVEEIRANPNVSFNGFLTQYKELSDWLKTIQTALQQKARTKLALSEKYLSQSYYEEMRRCPKRQLLNDYALQLKQCQPVLMEEVDIFLKEVNTQWETILQVVTPTNINQDPQAMIKDLEADLECLKKWLDGIEDHLRSQMTTSWQYEELEGVLNEHKLQQRDIESHSRIVSAVLKLSDHLHDNNLDDDSLETAAHNLERRWHGIWLQSLEWQCRVEDAISRQKGIFSTGNYLDPSLRDFTDDDEEDYDSQDVTSGAEDSFPGLGYRGDFIQSPPLLESSTLSQSSDFDRNSGKDSAVASESEQKTSSDMSENYQDLSVSTSSDSEREYLRQIKMRKHDSHDIGYGSESQSDDIDGRYKGITFSGISGRANKTSIGCGNYYATVAVDTSSTEKTEGWVSTNPDQTCDDSDINAQIEQVLKQEEPEMEDIRFLIDQADIMVQQGNTFNKSKFGSPSKTGTGESSSEPGQESLSSSSSSGAARDLVDKAVGTVESSCDASDEESGDSDDHQEDGTETIDSVIASEYTSDEMRYNVMDYSKLPKLYDTNSLKTRNRGGKRERPWSVVEIPNVMEHKLSNSESAIDKLSTAYSDSDIPSNKSRQSHSLSPTLSRHRIRRAQCVQRATSHESTPKRSQIGAKRKLNLPISPNTQELPSGMNTSASCVITPTNTVYSETIHINVGQNVVYELSEGKDLHSETCVSGNASVVPFNESGLSEDEALTPLSGRSGLISTLQNARFKSSGSSQEDSETQGDPTAVSEIEDPNDGNFSEAAWDNYQASLYPTGSESQPEDALTWEPGEMEFDDEFSLPQSTILATLLARRSEEETYTGVPPKLVPSSKDKFEDSDSDIEDLHHVLEESRMQLKVADRSLKKKRKDPLKTGLYLNPGKYGELLATIETNIKCLEAISQHIDQADVTEADIQTIQDLLYQWEKLHALASDRRNQSHEVKTMYATYLSVEGVVAEGVPQAEKRKFKSMADLEANVLAVQDKQKFLQCQKQMLADIRGAIETFSTQNPTVNMEGFLSQIQDTEFKIEDLIKLCQGRVLELEHIHAVWNEYKEQRVELEFLLTQERELLERLAFSQEVDEHGFRAGAEADLKKLVNNLALYEEKLITLQMLRAQLLDVSDEEMHVDLTASIADIRNQLFVAQRQCQEIMDTDLITKELQEKDLEQDSGMEIEDRMEVDEDFSFKKTETVTMTTAKPRIHKVTKPKKAAPKLQTKTGSKIPAWMKSFPLQAIAFAVFLGLLYLFAPKSLHKLLDFTLRLSPELRYVNGPPPV